MQAQYALRAQREQINSSILAGFFQEYSQDSLQNLHLFLKNRLRIVCRSCSVVSGDLDFHLLVLRNLYMHVIESISGSLLDLHQKSEY